MERTSLLITQKYNPAAPPFNSQDERQALRDHPRKTYLGLDPHPLDREASRRVCG
jgi:hypothetical protein